MFKINVFFLKRFMLLFLEVEFGSFECGGENFSEKFFF